MAEQIFRIRKIDGEWNILTSPDGEYPSGGYFKTPTGCRSKSELLDKLEIETTNSRGETPKIKLISI